MSDDELDIYPSDEDERYRDGCLSGYALLDAARRGDLTLCKEILEAPVSKRGLILPRVLGTDDNGNTALHLAVQNGHIGVVKCLMKQVFFRESRNSSGKTPREVAEEAGQARILKAISKIG